MSAVRRPAPDLALRTRREWRRGEVGPDRPVRVPFFLPGQTSPGIQAAHHARSNRNLAAGHLSRHRRLLRATAPGTLEIGTVGTMGPGFFPIMMSLRWPHWRRDHHLGGRGVERRPMPWRGLSSSRGAGRVRPLGPHARSRSGAARRGQLCGVSRAGGSAWAQRIAHRPRHDGVLRGRLQLRHRDDRRAVHLAAATLLSRSRVPRRARNGSLERHPPRASARRSRRPRSSSASSVSCSAP